MSQLSSDVRTTAERDSTDMTDTVQEQGKPVTGEVHPISSAIPAVGETRGHAEVEEPAGIEARRPSDPAPDNSAREGIEALGARLEKLEKHNRWLRFGMFAMVLLVSLALFDKLFPDGVIVHKTMMESKELKLLDGDGNARLFLRMYSRVPVLQIFDSNGKPRMSLGLRFDDTPFIELSDKTGNTRATFEMTEEDAPALRLLDKNGETTFRIN